MFSNLAIIDICKIQELSLNTNIYINITIYFHNFDPVTLECIYSS